ncbi:MAG: M3 family oligoendopeptidase [Oscillospiraceae bacterium]|jgi:pepF/M3 family oligoendopeptidase|nr:M3 family oligoendopeptidase [Oscillospiraceae bacterium]
MSDKHTLDRWDLGILYTGFDDPAMAEDLKALDGAVAAYNELAAKTEMFPHAELIGRYLAQSEAMQALTSKLYIYANLRYSGDTTDAEASSMAGRLMAKMSAVAAADTRLQQAIAGFEDLETILAEDEKLSEYRFLLTNIQKDSQYLLSAKEEELFARMNISGASAWEDLQSSLTSTVQVDYRGDTIPLSAARNLAYNPDPAVRRDAYQAELACYDKIRDSVAFSLNSIKLQVLNECELRGYESPLQKALYKARMKRETLDALLDAMQEYLPKFWQYLKAKAKTLGHGNGLPWYDLFAPMGKSDRKYTVEEARDYLLDIFKSFDSQLHDMVARAFNEGWIDFYPREGKVGGAFDCGVPTAGQSRILTNFDGAFGDVVTLAHELGHAFHDQQVFSHPILNQDYTMPVAETASTFNEVVIVSAAIRAAKSKEEKLALIESQLMDACQIICDIYSRYLFERSVFEARPQEFLNADRLCELMLNAQKTAYGDGLDPDCLHPYMWLCKSHYYSGGLSFYNFPYAFGGLFARGLYAKYLQEGAAFVPTYKALLHATSVSNVEDCARMANIDLTDKAFWQQALQSLADEIDEFCALVEA